jgi:heat shock protein HspQ
MQVGDLVRHKLYPEYFGIVTQVAKHRITFYCTQKLRPWNTYPQHLEKLCK